MNMKLFLAAGVLLLSACASTSTRDGLVYRDGSWYSPAADGRGDYYTGRYRDAWDHPYDFSIGVVPYGGYCPVRYRYCTSFWRDPFFGPRFGHYDPFYNRYYDPFYNPYWYRPWVYYRPVPRHHHRRRPPVHPGPGANIGPATPRPIVVEPRERPQPRAWEERPQARKLDRDSDAERPRRRVSDGGSE